MLTITPPWITPQRTGRHVVVIEPAEAFGTGTHETTQGCLLLLEETSELLGTARTGWSLLDVGCGSGILAVAGVKLGFSPVKGIDNDPIAVDSARRNAHLNGLEHGIDLECMPLEGENGTWDVVVANLDPLALTQGKERLVALCRRFLILSGVPSDQWDRMKALLSEPGPDLTREIVGSEWACGLFTT
jgi:ribosomal protein L11 methyltransferase